MGKGLDSGMDPLRQRFLMTARLAQSAERKALNLVVVGSSPTVGEFENLCGPTAGGK